MTRFILLFCVACLCAAGCDSPTSANVDGVHVEISGSSLAITNLRDVTIYYAAYDQVDLALVDWVPCTDPDACPRVPPGREHRTSVPPGESPIVVYWWHLVPVGGEFETDEVRTILVDRH